MIHQEQPPTNILAMLHLNRVSRIATLLNKFTDWQFFFGQRMPLTHSKYSNVGRFVKLVDCQLQLKNTGSAIGVHEGTYQCS